MESFCFNSSCGNSYFLLNAVIVLTAFNLALSKWEQRYKFPIATLMIAIGSIIHIVIGFYYHSQAICADFIGTRSFLNIANACIPSENLFIIAAQVLILAGIFMLISLSFKRYQDNLNKDD